MYLRLCSHAVHIAVSSHQSQKVKGGEGPKLASLPILTSASLLQTSNERNCRWSSTPSPLYWRQKHENRNLAVSNLLMILTDALTTKQCRYLWGATHQLHTLRPIVTKLSRTISFRLQFEHGYVWSTSPRSMFILCVHRYWCSKWRQHCYHGDPIATYHICDTQRSRW